MQSLFAARVLIPAILFLGLPATLPAESNVTDWTNLSSIKTGQRVEILDFKMKRIQAEFVSVQPDQLQILVSGVAQNLPRNTVMRVSLVGTSKRSRNVLLGTAIGAGAGLLIGSIIDARFSEDDEHVAKLLCIPIGAAAGAGVGSAFTGFKTVYRGKLPPQTVIP